jgi:hypothetical protein
MAQWKLIVGTTILEKKEFCRIPTDLTTFVEGRLTWFQHQFTINSMLEMALLKEGGVIFHPRGHTDSIVCSPFKSGKCGDFEYVKHLWFTGICLDNGIKVIINQYNDIGEIRCTNREFLDLILNSFALAGVPL